MIIFKGYKRKQEQCLDLAFQHHVGKKKFFLPPRYQTEGYEKTSIVQPSFYSLYICSKLHKYI